MHSKGKVANSNPSGCSVVLWETTSLRGSRWPKCQNNNSNEKWVSETLLLSCSKVAFTETFLFKVHIFFSFVQYTIRSIIKMIIYTAWKVSNYRVFSCPYFPVFRLTRGKCELEKTLCLDIFHAVVLFLTVLKKLSFPLKIF